MRGDIDGDAAGAFFGAGIEDPGEGKGGFVERCGFFLVSGRSVRSSFDGTEQWRVQRTYQFLSVLRRQCLVANGP